MYNYKKIKMKKSDVKSLLVVIGCIIALLASLCYQKSQIKPPAPPVAIKYQEKFIQLRATAFHLTKKETNKYVDQYHIDTNKISQLRYVAVSRELLDSLHKKLGDTIEVKEPFAFNGKWIILSVTNKKVKNTIDFLIPNCQFANLWEAKIKLE